MKMNKRSAAWIILVVMMVAVLALAGCGKQESEPEQAPEEPSTEQPSAGVANPWTDVKTAEEAAEGAGVEMFECAGIET